MSQGCHAICIHIAEGSSDMSYFYALKKQQNQNTCLERSTCIVWLLQ